MTGRSPVQPPDKSGQGEIKKKAEKLPLTTTEVSRPLILTAQWPTDKTVLVLSSDQGVPEKSIALSEFPLNPLKKY